MTALGAELGILSCLRLQRRWPIDSMSIMMRDTVPVPNPPITRSAERLSGAAVFAGTRVPVQTLIDYIKAGDSLDEFLKDFPSVSREHAFAVLELARKVFDEEAAAT